MLPTPQYKRARYRDAMSSTDLDGPARLRTQYAMSGTDEAYGGTVSGLCGPDERLAKLESEIAKYHILLLPYAVSSTEAVNGAT